MRVGGSSRWIVAVLVVGAAAVAAIVGVSDSSHPQTSVAVDNPQPREAATNSTSANDGDALAGDHKERLPALLREKTSVHATQESASSTELTVASTDPFDGSDDWTVARVLDAFDTRSKSMSSLRELFAGCLHCAGDLLRNVLASAAPLDAKLARLREIVSSMDDIGAYAPDIAGLIADQAAASDVEQIVAALADVGNEGAVDILAATGRLAVESGNSALRAVVLSGVQNLQNPNGLSSVVQRYWQSPGEFLGLGAEEAEGLIRDLYATQPNQRSTGSLLVMDSFRQDMPQALVNSLVLNNAYAQKLLVEHYSASGNMEARDFYLSSLANGHDPNTLSSLVELAQEQGGDSSVDIRGYVVEHVRRNPTVDVVRQLGEYLANPTISAETRQLILDGMAAASQADPSVDATVQQVSTKIRNALPSD